MSYIAAALHTLGLTLAGHLANQARTAAAPASLRPGTRRRLRSQDGSVTIEQVLWAVAAIAIVAIVVAAVRAYVTTQSGNIT